MKQFRNIRRGLAALFAIVLVIAMAGSTVYAADGAAQKASYPEFKYKVKHYDRYVSELPDSDQLSMEKAAVACAKYIYDMYGEDGDGNTMWLTYSSRAETWGGRVTKSGDKVEKGTIIFSFHIDAIEGKRICILDMRDTGAGLPEKSMTREKEEKLQKKTPDNLDSFKKLANEYAQKHFYDDKVESLDYIGLNCADVTREDGDYYYYRETHLRFLATDSTGRESEIKIVMETGKLKAIIKYVSDEEKMRPGIR